MTHTGGTTATQSIANRLQLYNTWVGAIAENIIDAKIVKNQPAGWTQAQIDADNCDNAIAFWHIDSGVSNRGHYSNSLNCSHEVMGVGFEKYDKPVSSLVNGAFVTVNMPRDRITEFFAKAGSCRTIPINKTALKTLIGFNNVSEAKIRPPCVGVVDT